MIRDTRLTRLRTHEHRLDNGLVVLVREDPSAGVVAVVARVGVGYLDEPDEQVGVSHVVEHMVFRGTRRRAAGDLARETRAAGGSVNGGTLYEATTYQAVLPPPRLALGLDLLADALGSPVFDEEELRRELLVIAQEARKKRDDPDAVAGELLFREMFDAHRLGRWRIGTEEGLAKITREDVVAFHQAWYRPTNMVLAVAGNVVPRRVLELADRFFGALGSAPGPRVSSPAPAEPERVGLRFRESVVAGGTTTRMDWGWRTPGAPHPSTPAVELLAVILGQGRASRLFRGVRETGRATDVVAFHHAFAGLGVLGVSAHLPLGEEGPGVAGCVWSEVDALRRGEITPEEVDRARSILEARALRRVETVEGQARLLAEWQGLGDWRLGERHLRRLFAATPADIARAADEHLVLDRATVLIRRPEGTRGWTSEALGRILRGAAPVPRGPRADGAVGGHPRYPPPPAGSEKGWDHVEEHGIHLYEDPGGLRLVVKLRRAVPLVSAGIFFPGGTVHEDAAEAGITRFMCRASLQGTLTRAAERVAREMEALGGVVAAAVLSEDLFHWSLSIPSRHFEPGLALLADTALAPSFPAAALERERRAGLDALERLRDDAFRYPLHMVLRGAFPGHPYGFSADAKRTALCRFTSDEVLRWHRREVLQTRPCVVVVGDVDPARAADLVARHVAFREAPEPRPEAASPPWPHRPRDEMELRPRTQTALALGFPGPARESEDLPVLQLLSAAVRGSGGRWFEELRGRRSLAYNLSAFPVARRGVGAFVAYIATSPEREEEARARVLAQFELLVREGLSSAEVEQARGYASAAWSLRHQTNAAQLETLAEGMLLGQGPGELHEHETRLRSVTPERIHESAERYFRRDRLVTAILRGRVRRAAADGPESQAAALP